MTEAPPRRTPPATRIPRSGQILDLVRRGQASTTGELAQSLGLARSTVNDRIEVLLGSGLLTTDEPAARGARGRPAATLRFNPGSGTTLAAQLGLSGVRVAVTDLAGRILWSELIDIDLSEGPDRILGRLTDGFERGLVAQGSSTDQVHGIGLGTPGRAELLAHVGRSGSTAAATEWSDAQLRDRLHAWLPVPVFVDHDVNLLAFGEHCARAEAAGPAEILLALKVGTVIGCGLVIDGTVIRGATSMAGEIGHTPIAGADAPCSCGRTGCLNAVASGGALAQQLRAAGSDTPDARSVVRLAQSGDVVAGQAIRQAGHRLGEVLAGAVNLLNPSLITLWGYLADAEDQLAAGIREGIARNAHAGPAGAVRIEPASLGADAGLYGAAMTVVEHTLQPDAVDSYLLTNR